LSWSQFVNVRDIKLMENKKQFRDSGESKLININSDRLITSCRVWLEVKDVMNKNVITIAPDEPLISAAKSMYENNVSCIVVTDKGSVVGILTEKDFLARIAGKNSNSDGTTVAETMSFPVNSISHDLSIFDASRIMETKNIKRLPILKENQLVGIVTQTDLTRALTSYDMWKDVAEIMSSDTAIIQTKATIAEAAEIMNTRNISCIAVLEGKKVQGIITERDILRKVIVYQKDPNLIKAEEVMSSPVITIPTSYSVFSASKTMDKMHVRRLLVMEDEQLCGIITQTDIFRATKKKLQEEEEKNFQLLERSKNSIYTLDPEGKITYFNPAFMKLLEVSDPSELINQTFLPERFWVNPDERTQYLRKQEKGSVEIKELALKTSKGNRIYVTLFSTFTKNIHGEINGNQGILYNITDRKSSEESAAKAYEELKKSHLELTEMQSQLVQSEKLASIGQLTAGIAHEMNNPVGFVAGNFQTLESHVKKILELLAMHDKLAGEVEPSGNPQLQTIVDGIGKYRDDKQIDFILEDIQRLFVDSKDGLDRTVEIIRNLRDFSRIDQPGSRDEYDLNKGIEATLIVAKNEIKYDADVKTEFSEVPLIYCHCGQINQVLLNILVNAAQAIKSQERDDRGTITIRTYASDDGVVCEICDDGPGVPSDKISKVFDPFFTTKPPGKGTGLGLSVSYGIIVNKHKGKLLVDSTVGEGTKFTINLPIGTKENDEEEEKETISNGQEISVICGR
jgi:PAS domain S-box-containing protein